MWTVLLEVLGLAATCGPMAFHFDPPIGGVLYWWQQEPCESPTQITCPSRKVIGAHPGTRALQAHVSLIMMLFLS